MRCDNASVMRLRVFGKNIPATRPCRSLGLRSIARCLVCIEFCAQLLLQPKPISPSHCGRSKAQHRDIDTRALRQFHRMQLSLYMGCEECRPCRRNARIVCEAPSALRHADIVSCSSDAPFLFWLRFERVRTEIRMRMARTMSPAILLASSSFRACRLGWK